MFKELQTENHDTNVKTDIRILKTDMLRCIYLDLRSSSRASFPPTKCPIP